MLKRLLLLTLCVLLLVAPCACGEAAEEEESTPGTNQTQKTVPATYVPDETINRFIVALKTRGAFKNLDILSGTSPDEFVVLLGECRISLTAGKRGMAVVVQADRGETGQKNLFAVFSLLTQVADKSCTEAQLEEAFAFMKQYTDTASPSHRVCNEVKIMSYSPSVKVGGTETGHRLDLLIYNYVAAGQTQ
ncbi:MAG: hypothetical protein E7527_04920 [Ruminococcaceae bacterium]|nr:hypothetical protein [Oscillospiraceae bacterium]